MSATVHNLVSVQLVGASRNDVLNLALLSFLAGIYILPFETVYHPYTIFMLGANQLLKYKYLMVDKKV